MSLFNYEISTILCKKKKHSVFNFSKILKNHLKLQVWLCTKIYKIIDIPGEK